MFQKWQRLASQELDQIKVYGLRRFGSYHESD